MSVAAQCKSSSFVVRCGPVFLGLDASRAGSYNRARRFDTEHAAEIAAEALRKRGGLFELPWVVEPLRSDEVR